MIKDLFFKYQRAFFYVAQARVEIGKPLGLYLDAGMAILLLKAFGLSMTPLQAVVIYCIGLVVLAIAGYFLTRVGVVRFNTSLGNKQNKELIEIMKIVRKLEKKQHGRNK